MDKSYLRLVTVLIFSFFIQDICSKSHGVSSMRNLQIVGGKNTTIEEHPYQVVLMCPELNFVCGGTIISSRFILTAAQCVRFCSQFKVVQVRVGSTYHDRSGTVYTALRMKAYPNNETRIYFDFDVGVIELEKDIPLNGKTTKAISLPPLGSAPVPAGTNVTITGWGYTSENGQISTDLMAVTVPTVSNEDCRKSYSNITARMFCAGVPQGGKDSCRGDSGGPAVNSTSSVQLGVVSFGIGCARAGYPGVYANLANSAIRRWIQVNTGV